MPANSTQRLIVNTHDLTLPIERGMTVKVLAAQARVAAGFVRWHGEEWNVRDSTGLVILDEDVPVESLANRDVLYVSPRPGEGA